MRTDIEAVKELVFFQLSSTKTIIAKRIVHVS